MPRPFITISRPSLALFLRRSLRPSLRRPLRSAPWHLLLVAALLFASVQDLRHEHADGLDARTCYTCHFSVELGALPGTGAPAERRIVGPLAAVRDTAAPRGAARFAYDARGPPLLS